MFNALWSGLDPELHRAAAILKCLIEIFSLHFAEFVDVLGTIGEVLKLKKNFKQKEHIKQFFSLNFRGIIFYLLAILYIHTNYNNNH